MLQDQAQQLVEVEVVLLVPVVLQVVVAAVLRDLVPQLVEEEAVLQDPVLQVGEEID